MLEFVRRNLFLVLGVTLPLALIGLILAVQAVHRWGVEPPETPVLYIYRTDYFLRQHLEVDVEAGRLSLTLRRPVDERTTHPVGRNSFSLAIYDASTGALREFGLELPDFEDGDPDEDDGQSLAIELPPELAALRLSTRPQSPEGFRFRTRSRSRGGLFGELFGYGSYGVRFELERDGIGFRVPGEGGYMADQVWIGWVIES